MVDDSDDARLFIELSSHAAGLVEARDALALAQLSTSSDSPIEDAERSLVASAVMAYCRTFFASNVRRPVTRFVELPQELSATVRSSRCLVNTTPERERRPSVSTYCWLVGCLCVALARRRPQTRRLEGRCLSS